MQKQEALEQISLLEEMEQLITEYQKLLQDVMSDMTNSQNDGES